MEAYCEKCDQTREVRGGMFGRHCAACGEPLMQPAQDPEQEPEDDTEIDGDIF